MGYQDILSGVVACSGVSPSFVRVSPRQRRVVLTAAQVHRLLSYLELDARVQRVNNAVSMLYYCTDGDGASYVLLKGPQTRTNTLYIAVPMLPAPQQRYTCFTCTIRR